MKQPMRLRLKWRQLHVEQEELEFLQLMRDLWNLDELSVAAIERSARVRFRKL